jgi:hypothetical protein
VQVIVVVRHREWVEKGKVGLLFKRQIICGFFGVVILGRGVVFFRLVVFLYAWEWHVLLSVVTKYEAGWLFWLCALCCSDGDGDGFFVINLGDLFRFF